MLNLDRGQLLAFKSSLQAGLESLNHSSEERHYDSLTVLGIHIIHDSRNVVQTVDIDHAYNIAAGLTPDGHRNHPFEGRVDLFELIAGQCIATPMDAAFQDDPESTRSEGLARRPMPFFNAEA